MQSLIIIAQSTPDIGGVPSDFVKYFMMMTAFVVAGVGGVFWGKRGSKGSPFHIEQPIGVKGELSQAPVYAQQSALDKLRADVEARTRENLRQHEESSRQVAHLIESGNERLQSMLKALHEMETRMTSATINEVRGLHERINPLEAASSSHKAEIAGLRERLTHIWEMIQSLYSQVFRKPAPRS